MKPPVPEECAALMGLDRAAAKHEVCIQATGAARREGLVLEHRPEALEAGVCTLRTRCNGQPVVGCRPAPL
ncbi:MAG TPA: hypothetical protein VIH59_24540 [Candidatus Tectomicrobia bacterium]|jgi:hypothetical protein